MSPAHSAQHEEKSVHSYLSPVWPVSEEDAELETEANSWVLEPHPWRTRVYEAYTQVLEAYSRARWYTHESPAKSDVPSNLDQVELAIKGSRAMLDWQENWDGEGAPRFDVSTWERARDFVRTNTIRLWELAHVEVPVPELQPTRAGGINIEWDTPLRSLLVNVPADSAQQATFYANLKNDPDDLYEVEGGLDVAGDNRWLLMWILQ